MHLSAIHLAALLGGTLAAPTLDVSKRAVPVSFIQVVENNNYLIDMGVYSFVRASFTGCICTPGADCLFKSMDAGFGVWASKFVGNNGI